MNGKQARMLRQMMATKSEIRTWKSLSKDDKGKLRMFHKNNPKLGRYTLKMSMEGAGIQVT